MICRLCNHDNPESNHFCGNCGVALIGKSSSHVEEEEIDIPQFDPEAEVPSFTREPDPPVVVQEQPQPVRSISGPSFLGLTDSTADETDYLLEEETPRRGRAGWIVFSTVAVIVLAVIGWIEWRAYQTGKVDIPFLKSSSSEQPKTSDEGGNTASADNTAEPKPQAEANSPISNPADTSQSNPGLASTTTPETLAAQSAPTKPEPAIPASATPAAAPTEPTRTPPQTEAASVPAAAPKPEASKPKPEIAKRETAKAEIPKPEMAKPADPRQNKLLLLGQQYLYGRGVPKSCSQALTYFQSAANENNAPAMSQLGAMYASGNCVGTDRRTAYRWFVRAGNADPSNPWIQRNLNMIWRDMSPEERASVSNR